VWKIAYTRYFFKGDIPRQEGEKLPKESLIEQLENLSPEQKAMLNRLKRVEGQLRGIQRMIIENKPCHNILIQLSAARKAMHQVCIEILKNYIQRCLATKSLEDTSELETLISAMLDLAPLASEKQET
jgi:DNA-binding FrmR family transcriptional regulator